MLLTPTAAVALDDFIVSRQAAGRSPATCEFYRYALARFFAFCPWPPHRGEIEAFFLSLRQQELSDATIYSYHRALHVFLAWAVRRGQLDTNPLDDLPSPTPPDPMPRAIPKDTLRRLFETIDAHAASGGWLAARDHAMFRVIYAGGLRASEAANLRVRDVNIERGSVIVLGKGKKHREVFLGEKTAGILARWLALLHPGCAWCWPSALLLTGPRPITRGGINHALHTWCDRAGVPRFRVHDLRHSYCVHALQARIPAREVSDQAGHSDVAFTLRVYGKTSDEDRRQSHMERGPGNDA